MIKDLFIIGIAFIGAILFIGIIIKDDIDSRKENQYPDFI